MTRAGGFRSFFLCVLVVGIFAAAASMVWIRIGASTNHMAELRRQRLQAMTRIESDSGFVTFRTKEGGIAVHIDDEVRQRERVERIYLASCELTEETLALLSAFQEATFISFNSSDFSDRHVGYLAPLVNLTAVQLNGTDITDDGLSQLLRARRLKVLTLNDTEITDKAVNALASMDSLTKLHLFGTNLTDAGVRELQSRLPNCEIGFAPGPKKRPRVAAKRTKPLRKIDPMAPVVTLGPIPQLALQDESATTPEELDQIKAHIRKLAEIDRPDFGWSSTMTGHAFLPIKGRETVGMVLFTNHQMHSSESLRELVKRGPKSLPLLLESLDDKTPTKLSTAQSFGMLMFHCELWGNPVNKTEHQIVTARSRRRLSEQTERTHVVTVGDVCFVAIGQIVGRPYQTIRYQPTACVVVNSPTRDLKLCEEVRAIWSSDEPRRKLFESLLQDYATQGIFNGESLDGWSLGSHLQIEAALRLLYYFPRDSAPLIAGRLNSLNVDRPKPPAESEPDHEEANAYMIRDVTNGVRTKDFIEAILWSDHPLIKDAVTNIENRTDDPEIREAIQKLRP